MSTTTTNTLPPPPPPTVYAHVLPHPKHKGRVTPDNWEEELLEFQKTPFALQSMRDVWQWEQGNKAKVPDRGAAPRPPIPDRQCDWCKETFTPRNGRQLRCSKECSNKRDQAMRGNQNPPRVVVCAAPDCNESFTTTDYRKVYCSKRCNKRRDYQIAKGAKP